MRAHNALRLLIREFVLEGKDSFTYKEARIKYYGKLYPKYGEKLPDWHSIEREIRKFAEQGWLAREWLGKRKVRFHISPQLRKKVTEVVV